MIEIHGSCTRHPPSQLISTTTEMSSPSTMVLCQAANGVVNEDIYIINQAGWEY